MKLALAFIYRLATALLFCVASAADTADDAQRRIAAEKLIKERSRECSSRTAPTSLADGQAVRISSEYLFAHELGAPRRAQIVDAGDQFVSDALRSVGLNFTAGSDRVQAVVAVTLFGTAKAWLYSKANPYGPDDPDEGVLYLAYPDVIWTGVVTVSIDGKCVCAELVRRGTPQRAPFHGTLRRTQTEAPYRRDLGRALAPVLLRLAKDLYGPAAIIQMAVKAEEPQLREVALAQIRDQATLAEIARHDPDEHLRYTASLKLTDQSTLAMIAANEPNRNIRMSAVRRLTDPAALSLVAAYDPDPDVRREAQRCLSKVGHRR